MRLFIALLLPAGALETALARAAALAPRLPPARWVPPDNLHLTLLFLGETPAAAVAPLADVLGAVARPYPPLVLRLAGGGTFPPRRAARVAWVGFEGSDALLRLQREIAAAAGGLLAGEARGESLAKPDRRPFRPHLTLARCPRGWPRAAAAIWQEGLGGPLGPPFEATSAAVVRSQLAAGGSRYEILARLPLGGERPAAGGEPGSAAGE